MATGNYEYQSEFHKKADALGRARGEAAALLRVLAKRRIELTEEQKRRILECTDLAVLDRWIDDAVTIASADELFTS